VQRDSGQCDSEGERGRGEPDSNLEKGKKREKIIRIKNSSCMKESWVFRKFRKGDSICFVRIRFT
jgi:hypothetical protein